MARKLQLDEEEESKFRRDVTDLSRKLALEAQDRELARTLQEKEKARLRKAKEKARMKAMQKLAHSEEPHSHEPSLEHPVQNFSKKPENVLTNIDPTWSRRQLIEAHSSPLVEEQVTIPITDLGKFGLFF